MPNRSIAACALFLALAASARADEGWGEPVGGIRVGLEPAAAGWVEGELMPFTVRVRNDSKETVKFFNLGQTWFNNVTFDTADGGESFWGGSRLFVDYESTDDVTLAPGETWTQKIVLHDEGHEFLRIVPDRRPGDDWDYRTVLPAGRYDAWIAYESKDPGDARSGKLWTGKAASRMTTVTIRTRNGAPAVHGKTDIEALPADAKLVRGTNLDDAALAILATKTALEELDLSFNPRLSAEGLASLKTLAKARKLDLSYCPGFKGGVLKGLAGMPALEELRLVNAAVDDDSLAGFEACPALKTLVLGGPEFEYDMDAMNRVGDAGLARLCRIPTLRTLVLRWLDFSPAALKALADLPNLKELDLHGGDVTDEGAEALAALDLEVLDCGDSDKLHDAGLKHLFRMQGLRSLGLSECGEITDAGLDALHALKGLKSLDLRECPKLTDAGLAKLRAALPGCEVRSGKP